MKIKVSKEKFNLHYRGSPSAYVMHVPSTRHVCMTCTTHLHLFEHSKAFILSHLQIACFPSKI